MSTPPVFRPVVYLDDLGEQGTLPPGGIINAGGVEGPHFTVGGKAVIFADGTASDGSGPVIGTNNSAITGFEWVQSSPSFLWTIPHGRSSRKIQISIWDDADELLFADVVKIVDQNTVTITFNTPISGRAILMIF